MTRLDPHTLRWAADQLTSQPYVADAIKWLRSCAASIETERVVRAKADIEERGVPCVMCGKKFLSHMYMVSGCCSIGCEISDDMERCEHGFAPSLCRQCEQAGAVDET